MTAVYCKRHAEDGMVDVRRKLCSITSCTNMPSFNFEDSKTAAYCTQHAANGMVDVRRKRYTNDSCKTEIQF